MNTKVYTKEEKARYAEKAWPKLVLMAEKGDTLYYSDLGAVIGIDNPQEVRHALSPIQNYCRNHDVIPHLTSLVVNMETGKPGDGYIPKLGTYKEDQDAVHAFNWKEYPNPGYDAFFQQPTE